MLKEVIALLLILLTRRSICTTRELPWSQPDLLQRAVCGKGEAIYEFKGRYIKDKRDREFQFGCTKVGESSTCHWTGYLNKYDGPLNHVCDGYIGGIESVHDSGKEDRIWKFYCCTTNDIRKLDCNKTPYQINHYRHNINFRMSSYIIFTGLESHHLNSKTSYRTVGSWWFKFTVKEEDRIEDRVWKVSYCEVAFQRHQSTCKSNQGAHKIKSKYIRNEQDRKLDLQCRNTPMVVDSCFWTSYSDKFHGNFKVSCKPNYFMSGVESYYSKRHEDREWTIKCCKLKKNVRFSSCKAKEINDWHEDIDYEVETTSSAIVGIESYYENTKKDRRWKVVECQWPEIYECPEGQFMYSLESTYNEKYKDRTDWTYRCRNIANDNAMTAYDYCYWTLPTFCTDGFAVAGIQSYLNYDTKVRQWKIKCCRSSHLELAQCFMTHEINEFKAPINYNSGANSVITGVYSYPNAEIQDSRWKVQTCIFFRPNIKIECPAGQGLYNIASTYSKGNSDRFWNYRCQAVEHAQQLGKLECYNSNDASGDFSLMCKHQHYLRMIESSSEESLEDRKWKIECCKVQTAIIKTCNSTSEYINGWRKQFLYEVSAGNFITGIESIYNKQKRDRGWKFTVCEIQNCS